MLKGAIFDHDGLMFDTEKVWQSNWQKQAHARGIILPDVFKHDVSGTSGDMMKSVVEKYYGVDDGTEIMNLVIAGVHHDLSISIEEKKGLHEIIEMFAAHGVAMAVASSSPENMIVRNLQNAGIDQYFQAVVSGQHAGVLVTKEMMKEQGEDWLVASASAYPAFPVKVIDGNEYVDGGYYDNFPVDYALQQGAEDIIGIDLGPDPIHPLYLEKDHIKYIHPREEMYNFLTFDQAQMQKAKILGYNDTMKTYGRLEGWKYTFVPFEYPSYFDEYYRGLLLLETRIKMATSINERFRSQQVVTDILKERMYLSHLTVRQYLYGIIDALMEMIGADSSVIYTSDEAKKMVLAAFAQCAYEDYAYKPNGIIDLAPYIKSLDQKGIVEKIIHANLYPNHRLFSDETLMTLHPFEVALADFVTIMMKHLPEE